MKKLVLYLALVTSVSACAALTGADSEPQGFPRLLTQDEIAALSETEDREPQAALTRQPGFTHPAPSDGAMSEADRNRLLDFMNRE